MGTVEKTQLSKFNFIKVISYNSRGLPKSKNNLELRPDIVQLMESCHIIAIQETHYSVQDLRNINSIHDSFVGCGAAKIDERENIIHGRYSGGVAFLWRSELSRYIRQLKLNANWCVAIEVSIESTKFVILNVYMPYQKAEHEDLYMEQLGYIKSFIDDMDSTNLVIIGDFNANLGLTGKKMFTNHMIDFCNENSMIISSQMMLPRETYTYVFSREGVPYYSWLHHIVSSKDFYSSINNISVLYDIADEDHIPICMDINVSKLPKLTSENNECNSKISWDRVKECDLKKYLKLTDEHFSNIHIPVDALLCGDLHCNNDSHKLLIEKFYCDIINCLTVSSEHL